MNRFMERQLYQQQVQLQINNYFEQNQREEQQEHELYEITATFGDILNINDFYEQEDSSNNIKNESEIIEDHANLHSQQKITNCYEFFNEENIVNYEEDKDIPATFDEHPDFYDMIINQFQNRISSVIRDYPNIECDQFVMPEDKMLRKQGLSVSQNTLEYLDSNVIWTELEPQNFIRNNQNEVDTIQKESQHHKSDIKKAIQPYICYCGMSYKSASAIRNHIIKKGDQKQHRTIPRNIQKGRPKKLTDKDLRLIKMIYGKQLLDQDSLNTPQQVAAILQQFQQKIDEMSENVTFEGLELFKLLQKDKMMLREFFFQLPIKDAEKFIEKYVQEKIKEQEKLQRI